MSDIMNQLGITNDKWISYKKDYSSIVWKDTPQCTEDQWDQAFVDTRYLEKRILAYPTWQNQFDMQYWDQVNGTTTWKDAVAKVKADNPKPE